MWRIENSEEHRTQSTAACSSAKAGLIPRTAASTGYDAKALHVVSHLGFLFRNIPWSHYTRERTS